MMFKFIVGYMKPISPKGRFLTLTLAALTGGLLTGISSLAFEYHNNQIVAQKDGMMDHGAMGDGMSMDLGPADATYDLRFIDAMIPHHQGAVEMAQQALQKSKRPEIKKLAQEIIAAQNQEISALKQWRKQWYAKYGDTPMAWSSQMNHMMPMDSATMQGMMMSGDLGADDADFDLRFINAMIPHHEGAVVMAESALVNSERSEIKQLSQDILSSQKAEIEQMKQWRQSWYNQ